jgi:Ca2+:H+ antiporter
VNILWPFTIAALVLYFNYHETQQLWIFITAFIGMVPAANLIGFSGQELARKLPTVWGVILETTFGSIVEIILFMVLIRSAIDDPNQISVIRAAILGSILANLLFCLGLCFFVGGIFHPQQTFHDAISEVGSNLMLVAGFGLVIPTIYYNSLLNSGRDTAEGINYDVLKISRAAAIILLAAFFVYVWFQAKSHHGLYEDILAQDEERDHDRHKDLAKDKLTLTESILALLIALMFVSFMAYILVSQIQYIVEERGVSDAFIGLILIPLVEKVAEHLTAVDEAYDNQMNFALSHILGASIQTALLNTPLVVIVGWGLHVDMSLNFELFDAVVLIMAIIVIGNFLRDEKSDYLEGALSVFVYLLIAVNAWYYPNPAHGENTAAHKI